MKSLTFDFPHVVSVMADGRQHNKSSKNSRDGGEQLILQESSYSPNNDSLLITALRPAVLPVFMVSSITGSRTGDPAPLVRLDLTVNLVLSRTG